MKVWSFCFLLLAASGSYSQSLVDDQSEALLLKSTDTTAINRLNRAGVDAYLANPEKTELFGNRALILSDSLHYDKGLADSYYTVSLISKLKSDDAEELDFHLKSLKILEHLGDSVALARTYNAIGVVYHNKGDFESANDFYRKALDLYEAKKDISGIASTLRKIGNMELDEGNFEKGLEAYKKSLEAETSINNAEGIANSLNNLGVAYYSKGKYDEALPYYFHSLELIQKINNLNRLPAAYHNIARVYLAQGKYDQALELALKDLPSAQKSRSRYAIIEAALLLSDIYQRKGDFRKAYEYLTLHDKVMDSVQHESNNIRFARLHAVYNMQGKEKELELIRKDHQLAVIRQQIVIGILFAAILIGGWVIYLLRNRVKTKQEIISKNQELHDVQLGLAKAELENKELNEKQLHRDLEFRHKELLTYTLNLVQKNTTMQHLRDAIHELLTSTSPDAQLKMTKLIKAIDYSLESEKDWDEFRMYFEKVHSSFFNNLKSHFPELSQTDLKLCALLSLNLSMKEMAELMGISTESVKMARHRLRKKLELATEENLTEFISTFKVD